MIDCYVNTCSIGDTDGSLYLFFDFTSWHGYAMVALILLLIVGCPLLAARMLNVSVDPRPALETIRERLANVRRNV